MLAIVPLAGLEPLAQDRGASGLRQTLRSLASPYRVLHVVAHPDDEDGPVLTYLSRGLGADVTIASVTRGESGANLVTGDFFDALGVLRTLEYRKAAQYYGTRLRFTALADFGYSKSLDETLAKWDRNRVTADLVRIIREERPHVVLSKWHGGPPDGHGHHQAAGLLAAEAYRAASDGSRYPEAGAAWAPSKLYLGNRREGQTWTLEIDAGVYDPLLGMTYAQMAREGLRHQRSQGAGSAIAGPGPSVRRYLLAESRVGAAEREESIFERIGLSLPAGVAEAVSAATRAFSSDDPAACLPDLLRGLEAVRAERRAGDTLGLSRLEERFEAAIRQSIGLQFDFLVEPEPEDRGRFSSFRPYETVSVAVPGSALEASVQFRAAARPPDELEIHVAAPDGWGVRPAGRNRFRVSVPADARHTAVHWTRASVRDASYEYVGPSLWGRDLPPAPLQAAASFRFGDTVVRARAAAQASFIDERRVQRRRDLAVGPAVSVEFPTDAGAIPRGIDAYRLSVSLRGYSREPVRGAVRLKLPNGWAAEPAEAPFDFAKEGEAAMIEFSVRPARNAPPGTYAIEAEAAYEGGRSSAGFRRIRYGDLETAYLARPARHLARVIAVKTAPGLRIGYVEGTGDDVPGSIGQLGAEVTLLDEADLASGDLSRFDAILLGIRAYAVREDLKAHNARLLDYVAGGGVLVVQYNTPEFDSNYGPYPYRMTRRPEEVSEEDSPVRILAPDDPVFNWPNRIGPEDFLGWVEQRGSKFLVEWDDRYAALLETHDTGQAPQRGGWVAARHGKGLYVYCAYAWYRQLPYAVPGAVRIFANILALGAADAPWR